MHPDSGCYEERYRLTWQVAGILAFGLLAIAAGVFAGGALAVHVTLIALGVPNLTRLRRMPSLSLESIIAKARAP